MQAANKDVVKDIVTASQLETELQISQAQRGVAVLDIYNAEWGHTKALAETFRRLFTDAGDLVHLRFFSVECNGVLDSFNDVSERPAQRKGMEYAADTLRAAWRDMMLARKDHSKPYFTFYKEGRYRGCIEGVDTPRISQKVRDLCKQQNPAREYITNADALAFWEKYFVAAESQSSQREFTEAIRQHCGLSGLSSSATALLLERVGAKDGCVDAAGLQAWVGDSGTIAERMNDLIDDANAASSAAQEQSQQEHAGASGVSRAPPPEAWEHRGSSEPQFAVVDRSSSMQLKPDSVSGPATMSTHITAPEGEDFTELEEVGSTKIERVLSPPSMTAPEVHGMPTSPLPVVDVHRVDSQPFGAIGSPVAELMVTPEPSHFSTGEIQEHKLTAAEEHLAEIKESMYPTEDGGDHEEEKEDDHEEEEEDDHEEENENTPDKLTAAEERLAEIKESMYPTEDGDGDDDDHEEEEEDDHEEENENTPDKLTAAEERLAEIKESMYPTEDGDGDGDDHEEEKDDDSDDDDDGDDDDDDDENTPDQLTSAEERLAEIKESMYPTEGEEGALPLRATERKSSTSNQVFTDHWVTVSDRELEVWNRIAELELHHPRPDHPLIVPGEEPTEDAVRALIPPADTLPTFGQYLLDHGEPEGDVNMMCLAADSKIGSESLSMGKLALVAMTCDEGHSAELIPGSGTNYVRLLAEGALVEREAPLAFTVLCLCASEAYPNEAFYYAYRTDEELEVLESLEEGAHVTLAALSPLHSNTAPEGLRPVRVMGLPKVIELASTEDTEVSMVLSQWYTRLQLASKDDDGITFNFVENVCGEEFKRFEDAYSVRLIADESRLDKKKEEHAEL